MTEEERMEFIRLQQMEARLIKHFHCSEKDFDRLISKHATEAAKTYKDRMWILSICLGYTPYPNTPQHTAPATTTEGETTS